MKAKRIVFAILLAVVMAFATCAFVACDGVTQAAVPDFGDKTDTAIVGETYVFEQTRVTDSLGGEHKIMFTVTDGDGQTVDVVNGGFYVSKKTQYTAVCSLEALPAVKRTITINVIAPKAVDADGKTFAELVPTLLTEGDEVAVPVLKAVDSDTNRDLCDLVCTVTVLGEQVTVEDGKFTALSGKYTFMYEGKIGKSVYKQFYEIAVERTAPAEREVESFNSPASISSVNDAEANEIAWLSEYKGERGVAKIAYAANKWPQIKFAKRQELSAYADYDYIVLRMFVTDGLENDALFFTNDGENDDLQWIVEKNAWHDYTMDIEVFKRNWLDSGCTNHAFIWSGETVSAAEVYIADISVCKELDAATKESLSVQPSDTPDEGSEVTLVPTVPEGQTATLRVYDPAGARVPMSGATFVPVSAGTYTVKIGLVGYVGEKSIELTVRATTKLKLDGEFPTNVVEGAEITLPAGALVSVDDENKVLANMTVSVTLDGQSVETTCNRFTPQSAGEYIVTYSGEYNNRTYTRTEKLTVNRIPPRADEIESFDSSVSVKGVVDAEANEIAWLSEYKGERGVAKIAYAANKWPQIKFAKRQELSAYADYDYIVLRMFVTDGLENDALFFTNDGENDDLQWIVEKNAWHDYTMDIEVFKRNWLDSGCTNHAFIWSGETVSAAEVYIADIYAVKAASKSGVTVGVSDSPRAGAEVTVTLGGNTEGAHLAVLDPSGNAVTLSADGKFTPVDGGDYTARVTVDGYYGAIEQTIAVQYAIDGVLTAAYATNIVAGSEVTVIDMELKNTSTNTVLAKMPCTGVEYSHGAAPALSNGKFVAQYAGTYTLTYEVTYQEQKYTKTVEVTVARAAANADEVESFDDPTSVDGLTDSATSGITWLPKYNGESGVAKLTYTGSGQWPAIKFTQRREMSDYDSYDYIVFRMYFSGGIPNDIYFTNDDGIDDSVKKLSIVKGKWYDYVFDISVFKKHWKDDKNSDKAKLWTFETTGNTEIYIADISVIKEPPVRADEVVSFDTRSQKDLLIWNGEFSSTEWLSEYKNEKGVMKISCVGSGKWPAIQFNPRQAMTAYIDYTHIVVRMYITGGMSDHIYFTNDETISEQSRKLSVVKDQWHDYEFDIAAFKKNWQDKDGGGFTLSDNAKICLYNGTTGDAQIYIADISVRKAA